MQPSLALIALLAVFLVCWLIGRGILGGFRRVPASALVTVFASLAIGQVLVSTTMALLVTRGATVHLICVALLAMLHRQTRPEPGEPASRGWRAELGWGAVGMGLALACWGLQFVVTWDRASGQFSGITGNVDDLFYLQVTTSMGMSHAEGRSPAPALLDPAFVGALPYHYTELWLLAAVNKAVGHLASAYVFVVKPLLGATCGLGVLAVMSRLGALRPLSWLALLLLFLPGFAMQELKKISLYSWLMRYSDLRFLNPPVFNAKMATLLIALLASSFFWLSRDEEDAHDRAGLAALTALSFLPVLNILFAPIVAALIGLAFLFLRRSKRVRAPLLSYLWVPTATLGWIGVFYVLARARAQEYPMGVRQFLGPASTYTARGLLLESKIFVQENAALLLLFGPFLVLLFALFRHHPGAPTTRLKSLCLYLGALLLTSRLVRTMGLALPDAFQFFMCTLSPVVCILGSASWQVALQQPRRLQRYALAGALVYGLGVLSALRRSPERLHDAAMARQIRDHLAAHPVSELGVAFFHEQDAQAGQHFSPSTLILSTQFFTFLPDSLDRFVILNVSEPSTAQRDRLATGWFADKLRAQHPGAELASLQREFLVDHRIRYGVASSRRAIPAEVWPLVSFQLEDPVSKELFVAFREPSAVR